MSNTIQNIPLDKIIKNRFQPEGVRDIAKVAEIVSSLKQNENNGTKGLLQVPTARKNADGLYELAFGHHRFYAFLHLTNTVGDLFFDEMPLIVRELTDIEMFELMAIENFHRRDIGPMEEAHTLNSYMTNFKMTSAETAKKFEKTEEYVRGSIRLLNLPKDFTAQALAYQAELDAAIKEMEK
jgi:ParB family chromosome partitioning protein